MAQSAEIQKKADQLLIEVDISRAYMEALKRLSLVKLLREIRIEREELVRQIETLVMAELKPAIDLELAPVDLTAPGFAPLPPASTNDLIRDAFATRLEILAVDSVILSVEQTIKAIRATKKPQAGSFLSGGYAKNDRPGGDWRYAAGVSIKIPLDFNRVIADRIRQAKAGLAELKARRDAIHNAVRLEVSTARIELENQFQLLRVDRKEFDQASSAYSLALSQYQNGLDSFMDLSRAEDILIPAKIKVVERDFDTQSTWLH